MQIGESTCEDAEAVFSVWILLRLICQVSAKLLTIAKSKVFPGMSRSWTGRASWFHMSIKARWQQIPGFIWVLFQTLFRSYWIWLLVSTSWRISKPKVIKSEKHVETFRWKALSNCTGIIIHCITDPSTKEKWNTEEELNLS